ncbi:ORF6C domain-containing protein [Paenibacillus sp. FSL P4-0176]|uniref:ORF6C domain-containing protein n=1 Tax=Paenibacillus sp. FSL P4-0176 TaxID=2921631 RepID=UPI0030CF2422
MKQIQVTNYNQQRVLTTAQLSESFGVESERINKNFHDNKFRFKEGKHFYKLEGESLLHFRNSEPQIPVSNMTRILYLWTEKGAWMHAKSLNTDQAWDAYEMLVDDYYKVKEVQYPALSAELQAIFALDQRTQEFDQRLSHVENNTTINFGQQRQLAQAGNEVVVSVLGGPDSPAYRSNSLRGKTYSALWRDHKDYFQTNSMRDTLVKDFGRALDRVSAWHPQGRLLREIEDKNRQMAFMGG